jgi:hypothetical protein
VVVLHDFVPASAELQGLLFGHVNEIPYNVNSNVVPMLLNRIINHIHPHRYDISLILVLVLLVHFVVLVVLVVKTVSLKHKIPANCKEFCVQYDPKPSMNTPFSVTLSPPAMLVATTLYLLSQSNDESDNKYYLSTSALTVSSPNYCWNKFHQVYQLDDYF